MASGSCAAVSVRGSSTSTVRCSVGFGVAVSTLTPSGAWKRCHVPCRMMIIIPALSAKDFGPSSVMMCSVAAPSTICTSSSPFGWRSHAPSPANKIQNRDIPSMASSDRQPLLPVFPWSGADADDLAPVGRVLVGVCDPHEERIVEEAPDELHADRETRRRLAHGDGQGGVAGVVEGQRVAVAAPARRQEAVLDGLAVAALPVVVGRR